MSKDPREFGAVHGGLVSAPENHLCDADFKKLVFSRRNLMVGSIDNIGTCGALRD